MTPPPLPLPAAGAAGNPSAAAGQAQDQQFRRAMAANVFLPGAGLFLLGDRRSGTVLGIAFLVSFVVVVGLFLMGYVNYLLMAFDPEVLQGDKLERIGEGFRLPWVLSFAGAGAVIYGVATVRFVRMRARLRGAGR